MNSILNSLTDSIKHLSIVRNLPDYFDREERRLVVQSVIIGVVLGRDERLETLEKTMRKDLTVNSQQLTGNDKQGD